MDAETGHRNRRQRQHAPAETKRDPKSAVRIPVQTAYLNVTGKYLARKDWVVEMVWFELAAPHAVLSNRVSASRFDRCGFCFRSARRADRHLGLNVHQARRHEEDAVAQQASLA